MSGTQRTKLHALLIGIDKYSPDSDLAHSVSDTGRIHNLTGAVADMTSVKEFLTKELHVPEGPSIQTLTDDRANRAAIVDAIERLGYPNNHIQHGDAILIYYAGHGLSTNKQEAIVPHGAPKKGARFKDLVSHSKFSWLLKNLAESKGDNITVILDCCHSAALTRGEEDEEYTFRGVGLEDVLDEDDVEVSRGLGGDDRGDTFYAGSTSHVLLAACAKDEKAREKNRCGLFTQELIRLLREGGYDKHTYADLISRFNKLAGGLQTPHCVGKNKLRKLFNAVVHRPSQLLHNITLLHRSDERAEYVIHNSGGVMGRAPLGTEFAVLDETADAATAKPLFHLTVTRIDGVSSFGRVIENVQGLVTPQNAYARRTKTGKPLGNLHVYVESGDGLLLGLFERARQTLQAVDDDERWLVSSVGKDEAHLGVYLEDAPPASLAHSNTSPVAPTSEQSKPAIRILSFKILDRKIIELGIDPSRLAFTVPATIEHLVLILRAASRFFYHLRRSPTQHQLRGKVSMHVYELVQTSELDDDFVVVLAPVPHKASVIPPIDNANDPSPWRVQADDAKTLYGVELQQKSGKRGLFASMFFFDCHTLEIRSMYGASAVPDGQLPVPPLQTGEPLPLNYGRGGGEPLRFGLGQGREIDVGFVKVFVSNEWFDLSVIDQPEVSTIEPNEQTRGLARETYGGKGGIMSPVVVWDEITLPVAQVKRLVNHPLPRAATPVTHWYSKFLPSNHPSLSR